MNSKIKPCPSRWSRRTLRELAAINYGRAASAIVDDDGQYPVYGTSGNERMGVDFLYEGDSVVIGRKGSIERVHFVTRRFWTIDTAYFLSDFNDALPKWLYYFLTSIDLRGLNEATGVPSLSRDLLYKIAVLTPPSNEQSKIAEVLSTVDRAIEQTEALIAKQQRIKTGLMQALLTHGIDEHGNLRSEETHEFKDSPLGRIPDMWRQCTLLDVLVQRPLNGIYKPASQIGSGTLIVGQTCFTDERRVDFSLARRATVTPKELATYHLKNGDILLTRVFATVDGVGRPVLVTDCPEEAVFESNMLRLRIDCNKIDPYLLFCFLASFHIRKKITAGVNASNQNSVNQTVINGLPVLVPPNEEQERIVGLLSTHEKQLINYKALRSKLVNIKTALMQDLLTGKVPVTPLLTEPQEASV